MNGINAWWESIRGERFWLGIVGRDDRGEFLATPCDSRHNGARRTKPLIHFVRDGDAVFHFDETRRAIVAWSTSRGRARQRQLTWSRRASAGEAGIRSAAPSPSWTIGLGAPTALASEVSLGQIARVQWDLFPALRAFEDQVGEPLHYPFEMGNPTETSLLSGHVFKLPAMFVDGIPALSQVAERMQWAPAPRSGSGERTRTGVGQVTANAGIRVSPASPRTARPVLR